MVEEAARGRLETLAFDREHLWHPYTSMTEPTPVRLVTGARGCELEVDGRWVVDGMSSWWSAIHGYRHPALDAALARQAADFSHVMFGGLTHEPAIGLAERLLALAPGSSLEKVFFADSGSVSVEVAMKMAWQAHAATGLSRIRRSVRSCARIHRVSVYSPLRSEYTSRMRAGSIP